MAKVNKARERFEAKKRYNQIVSELNQQRATGTNVAASQSRPDAITPGAPTPPQSWNQIAQQYQQQYGTPTAPVPGDRTVQNPELKYNNPSWLNVNRPATTPANPYGIQPWQIAQQQTLAAQPYNNTAQNPELKYNNPAWMSVNMPASVQPPAWWNQIAQQYAQQGAARGPIQPPESPRDDFYFRHPGTPTTPTTSTTSGSGGYGYGGYGSKKRRGGGGSRYGGYQPQQYEKAQYDNAPAWARGLANWSIG